MPVLLGARDVIVITDEAHRSQYDTLALNMRRRCRTPRFLGFTGTPLIAGEEKTREVFGDYVSIYNFRDSIEDGATVPLYYENRIPELQITNEHFDEELADILEEAELDDSQERRSRATSPPSTSSSRATERLRAIAARPRAPLRRARVPRQGDVRRDRQGDRRAHVRPRAGGVAESPRRSCEPSRAAARAGAAVARGAASRSWRRPTWRSSSRQAQNEIADMDEQGLDIRPHRERMLDEDLDERFKDPERSASGSSSCARCG